MKTSLKILNLCLLAVSFYAFSSCDDDKNDGDVTKPIINLEEPAEGDTLKIGAGIHFEMELSDDEMLKSYKVDIHSNFDGHVHSESLKVASGTVDFTYNHSWDVSGKKNTHIHHHEIVIPVDATPGKYHLMVYCTDEAGNESYIARNVVLSTEVEDDHDE
ncbi:MAG: DUF4625 domain-containing protein [Paludibacteraceae bacterium]|nr:DUF4625 domain-containing protein [Prevotellaceae bacterium]